MEESFKDRVRGLSAPSMPLKERRVLERNSRHALEDDLEDVGDGEDETFDSFS